MPNPLKISLHAVSMVFDDPPATLRATWSGVALIAVSAIIQIAIAPGTASGLDQVDPAAFGETYVENIALIPAILLMLVGYLMMIVAWHRFVLLPPDRRDEGFTPTFGHVVGYVGRSTLLGLVVAVAAVPLLVPLALVGEGFGDAVASIVIVPISLLIGWIFLRLALILPAGTIGQSLTLRESWAASRPLSGAIAGLLVILFVFDTILNTALNAVFAANFIGDVFGVAVSVLYALFSASILTTLYGIAVEGRTL